MYTLKGGEERNYTFIGHCKTIKDYAVVNDNARHEIEKVKIKT